MIDRLPVKSLAEYSQLLRAEWLPTKAAIRTLLSDKRVQAVALGLWLTSLGLMHLASKKPQLKEGAPSECKNLPSLADIFRSYYYKRHHHAPVDLSKQALQKHRPKGKHADLIPKVQKLFLNSDCQEAVTSRLTWTDVGVKYKSRSLRGQGFELLSHKRLRGGRVPFYSVLQHKDLPGWIIKSCSPRLPKKSFLWGPRNEWGEMVRFSQEDGLLRIAMAEKIRVAARELGVEDQVVVPTKYLVPIGELDQAHYVLLAQKLDLLSSQEASECLSRMGEERKKKLARTLVAIISKVGLADAHPNNIRLNSKGQLCFIDTEPAGVMKKRAEGFWEDLLDFAKPHSIEKGARVGLHWFSRAMGSAGRFAQFVDQEATMHSSPKLSTRKLALGYALPILPLIHMISSIGSYVYLRVLALIIHNTLPGSRDKWILRLQRAVEGIPYGPRGTFSCPV